MQSRERLLIFGAGGHSRVLLDIAHACGLSTSWILDDHPKCRELEGVPLLSAKMFDFSQAQPFAYIIGIGTNSVRVNHFTRLRKFGKPTNLVHPFSSISTKANLGLGLAIMPGVVVNTGAIIHDNVILNTGATIDHDCVIGPHAHICPGVHLPGNVMVGSGTMLGTGTSVIPGIQIGANCIIGAGSVVIRDIPENTVAFGNPARVIRSIEPDPNFSAK